MADKPTILDKATEGQKLAIIELLSELELDDAQNSIENATRCLEGQGYLELQNMVHNYQYRAGINHLKNEIREILGLPRLMTDAERRQQEAAIKYPMGSMVNWDCPALEPHEYEFTEGSAKLIPLGDDGSTFMVMGTKDRKKAGRMMRRYSNDFYDAGDEIKDTELEVKKVVWRKANQEYDGEHTHMFSWSSKDTKNNVNAVEAFIYEG